MSPTTTPTPLKTTRRPDGIVVLELSSPDRPVVVLDQALLDRLDCTLTAIESSDTPAGLIVTSACPRVFVAGADLVQIDGLDDAELLAYLQRGAAIFRRLTTLPCPSVCLIDGAALGGGLELALHCDAIVLAKVGGRGKPFPVGLPETGLGLCPGWGGTQTLPARIDPAAAVANTATGTLWMSDGAPAGLADVTVETPDDLMAAGIDWITNHADVSGMHRPRCIDSTVAPERATAIASAVAQVRPTLPEHAEVDAVCAAMETGTRDGFDAALAVEQRKLVALRHSDRARELLTAFFEKNS